MFKEKPNVGQLNLYQVIEVHKGCKGLGMEKSSIELDNLADALIFH